MNDQHYRLFMMKIWLKDYVKRESIFFLNIKVKIYILVTKIIVNRSFEWKNSWDKSPFLFQTYLFVV